ncbi:MAG TPA: enoyl-CoA hydratase/isomerase family protein [Candidatus Krumholzibacteria bacterium]|nr:enoyl-CoA hydratase/isomerase family protein [Candidatus Krumholzibacteria bacterium]
MSTEAAVVRVEARDDGAIWRVVLNTPRANILDREKSETLTRIFEKARDDEGVKAIILEGEGPNFSFGASVQEHLPESCAAMLTAFHGLFRTMLDASVVTLAAVRGHCLGGGLELAAFCNRVIAAGNAQLGQPEITLGVFAPVASVILCERMGRGGAEDLLLSGRMVTAGEALSLGLVDEIDENPSAAALAYARTHLLPRSASSLRWAVRAARLGFAERLAAELARVEAMYLQDLMSTADANEGLRAFIEKRAPAWRNR